MRYSEPASYIPKSLRKEYGLGEFEGKTTSKSNGKNKKRKTKKSKNK